ncbi:hypothetical protein GCM10023185_09990 [Hymenobacter saemangeumensis]|uniref:PKD domain-containing protein n=2 Tax=Hymenobacter saemangeumensis TaxID=1084522 RepID=A0ABP8I5B2_9BACT
MHTFTSLLRGKKLAVVGLSLVATVAAASSPRPVGPAPDSGPRFIPNQKQWEKPVLFAADVPGGRLFLERGKLTQALYDTRQLDELHHHSPASDARVRAHAYSVSFEGADLGAAVRGEEATGEVNNYFLGNDESRWATNVPAYAAVRYQKLYPGTDLRFYTRDRTLEYDFELAAGADAGRIRLRYRGQQGLRIVDGALHIRTSVGKVVEQRPYAYQLIGQVKKRVRCEYALADNNTVTFRLPAGYDHSKPLVIDPVLVYSTYSGSTAGNYGYTATYDSLGNLYAGGVVFSTGFPVTMGAYDVSYAGSQDMGIIKFNPYATIGAASRVYATYIGGAQADHPHSMVVDRNNNLVILGSTGSTDYPTTLNAYDRTLNGTDIVVTKLNAAGSALVGSTFLGGTGTDGQLVRASILWKNYGDEYRGDVIVDRQNNILLTSVTESSNFPIQGGIQSTRSGARDAVVVKFNPGLTALVWSTLLGGSGDDTGYSMQVDSVNNVFVSGGTTSGDFPGRAGGFRSNYQGGTADGFIARITAAGDDLVQSTYLGTTAYDQAYFVQLNRQGEVYAYGQTLGNYPVTAGLYSNPGSRQFIQKLNARLTNGIFSTVIGNGPGTDVNLSPTAFLVDNCGQILLSGWTAQGNMPVTPNAIQSTGGSGTTSTSFAAYFYIAQLSGNAQQLVYGTYFGNGNSHVDGGTSRFDKKGIIYQSMCVGSGSGSLPITSNAWSSSIGSGAGYNNAAFKIDVLQLDANFFPSPIPTNNPLFTQREQCAPARFYFNRPSVAGTAAQWDFGNGQTSTQQNTVSVVYNNPGRYAVRLTVFDPNSCLQSVSFVDTVKVLGLPRAAAGPDKTVCPGVSATITVADAGTRATYTWSPATGLNTTTGRTVIATPTVTTQYIVRVNIPGTVNCTAADTVVVNVRPNLAVSAGPDRDICGGTATTLTAPDFGTGTVYSWSPATGLSSTSTRSVSANPATTTTYTVQATDANGCTGQATVTVRVPARPNLAATVSSPNLSGKPVTFVNTTTGATSYRWEFGDNSPVSTEVNPTHTYVTNRATTFQARLTAIYGPSCEESITLPVPVRAFDLPNVITPNSDQLNDTFRPFVSNQLVDIEIFNRWGRKVFEQKNYVDGWGSNNEAAGMYYYRIVAANGETWKGWLELVR